MDGLGWRIMYLETVVSEIPMPRFMSSPWTRATPQSGLSQLIRQITSRTSPGTGGRPPFDRYDFQVQSKRKPLLCQTKTVSGLTIESASHQTANRRESSNQNNRSARRSVDRGDFLFIVVS